MDANAHQQAYDRGSTIFSPDGRLYQVEYAREAVGRGSPSVGVVTDDGVVLAARKRVRSPLLDAASIEKVHRIDDHVAVASAGHAADARQLVDVARRASQTHRLRYDEAVDVASLARTVADHVQEHTQTGGSRPYGAALLVAGVDPEAFGTDGPRGRLFEVDPSGTPYGWEAIAVGHGASELRGHLEDRLLDDEGRPDRRRGIALTLEVLARTSEDDLAPATVDVWTVDSEAGVDAASASELEEALDRIA